MMGVEYLLLIPFSRKLKLLQREELAIFAYLVSSIIFGTVSYILGFVYKQNNMLFNNCMTVIQFVILNAFYYLAIKSPNTRKVLLVLGFTGLAIFAMDLGLWEGPRRANSIFATYRLLLFLAFGIVLFFQLLKDEKLIEQSIYMNSLPLFWFNAGLFVFLCGSFVRTLTNNFIQSGMITGTYDSYRPIMRVVRDIVDAGGIIQFFLFYIGLTKIKIAR